MLSGRRRLPALFEPVWQLWKNQHIKVSGSMVQLAHQTLCNAMHTNSAKYHLGHSHRHISIRYAGHETIISKTCANSILQAEKDVSPSAFYLEQKAHLHLVQTQVPALRMLLQLHAWLLSNCIFAKQVREQGTPSDQLLIPESLAASKHYWSH